MGDVITTVPTTDSLVHYSEVCQMRRGIEEIPNEPRCRLTDRERQEVGCRYLDGTFRGGGGDQPLTHPPVVFPNFDFRNCTISPLKARIGAINKGSCRSSPALMTGAQRLFIYECSLGRSDRVPGSSLAGKG